MNFASENKAVGRVEAIIEFSNGKKSVLMVDNTVLNLGKIALAKTLANDTGAYTNFYINRMIFGDQGTSSGEPKIVSANRTGLFGSTIANKPVVAAINPDNTAQAIFTATLAYSDAVGYALSEMALVMNNNELFSMVTFPDLTKTVNMQIVFNWYVSMV